MPRLPRSISRLLIHLRLLWRAAPLHALICLALATLHAVAAVAAMISSGRLIGALAEVVGGSGDPAAVWGWLTATAAALVAGPLLAAISGGVEEVTGARYLSAYQDLLLDTATAPYSITGIRSPAGAQTLEQAAGVLQHWLFLRGVGGLWGVISSRLSGIGALVIVAGWHWWIAVILLVGWLILSRTTARWRSVLMDDAGAIPLRHRAAYLYRAVSDRASAKEVRLFGLAEWFVDAFVALRRQIMVGVAADRRRTVRGTVGSLILLLLLNAGAFGVLIFDVGGGKVTVASLVTLVQAMLALSVFGRQEDDETSLDRTATELSRLVDLRTSLGLPFPARAQATLRSPSSPPEPKPARIEIRGLTFGYPGRDSPVLEELELIIEPGECVAVVGPNGAGKSTLLGLLCGLWPAAAGTIRIDGRDPATDPVARSRIAPIFQQFLRLPLSAAENLLAGNRWQSGTDWARAAAQAGADTVIKELPDGPGTVLSAEFAGGTNLSGGQWQRIALARALTAIEAGAGLLALDEPTAALDVRAEVALFESVLDHRRRCSTLLITHRLSSVRHADRIAVLGTPPGASGARVIESGSHRDLIRLGGSYARMFELQAARFRGEL
ncbi:ATP-binding cassette domain-containing protein [Microlunatus speluncae]|uniref:ATP-binding cassette domain-containing protein n=1 Tax=Microlunatus speluncae TaxID=2594267 RepID=UPI0012667B0F|nr:ATP-binding cassette domain-containing protein [Microlunatus speluncae]